MWALMVLLMVPTTSWLLLISIATIFVSCVHTLFSCYLIKIKGFISNKIFNKNNDLLKISMMVNLFKDSPFDNILLSSFIQKKPLLFTLKEQEGLYWCRYFIGRA